jgi:hypothetical protein
MVTRPTKIRSFLLALGFGLTARSASADPAVRIGPRGGVEFRDGADPSVGVDLRLSFSRSPLTINPTFEYVFDQKITLYEASVNALYYLPLSVRYVAPYAGIGFVVTKFAYKESAPDVEDDNGARLGMNLAAGVCFDTPFVSPFVQVLKQLGELDHSAVAAGFVVALDRDDRWTGCGRRAR